MLCLTDLVSKDLSSNARRLPFDTQVMLYGLVALCQPNLMQDGFNDFGGAAGIGIGRAASPAPCNFNYF